MNRTKVMDYTTKKEGGRYQKCPKCNRIGAFGSFRTFRHWVHKSEFDVFCGLGIETITDVCTENKNVKKG